MRIHKNNLRLIAFCKFAVREIEESERENPLGYIREQQNPDFKPWFELVDILEEIHKSYSFLYPETRFKNAIQVLNREIDFLNANVGKVKEYLPSVLIFNMLQKCDLSELRSDGGAIDKLKNFEMQRIYPAIQKYNLRNEFVYFKICQHFKIHYWENVK